MESMLKSFAVAIFVVLASCAPGPAARAPSSAYAGDKGQALSRPNILFILVDDLGWRDVGFQGSEIQTPNLDVFARQGAILTRAYAFPICSPTRAALLTGRNPLLFGVDGPMENDAMLPRELALLPEYFRNAGYRTWMVGKWHLGMHEVAAMPHSRGFDWFYGHLGGFIDYYTHVYFGGLDWQRNGVSVREDGHATELLTREAISLIERYNGKNPFFMYLSYNAPHTPLQYTPSAAAKLYNEISNADRRVFAEMTTHLDMGIGEVLNTLNKKGLRENTLVVFMSDNGGNLEAGADNGKLQGGKGHVFEGGVRVPAILSWPAAIESGKYFERPIFAQDWAPTLLAAAGIDYADDAFDGTNVWPEIVNSTDIRHGEPVVLGANGSFAVYKWPYKLIRNKIRGGETESDQLFNVVSDPFEQTDIAKRNPELLAELGAILDALPKKESKGAKGPPPEFFFRDANGKFDYKIRMPETREPWAEAATRAAADAPEK